MRIRMAAFGRALGGRDRARKLLPEIEKTINERLDSLVLVDLTGVLISHSFGDELFATLLNRAQRGRYGRERWIAFTGADEFTAETLHHLLEKRGLAAALVAQGSVQLVGTAEGRLEETFQTVERLRRATAAVVAKQLGTSLQAANKWLTKLVEARVVDRTLVGTGSGRPYEYHSRTPELVGAGSR